MMRVVIAKLIGYKSFRKFLALHVAAVLLVVYVASSFSINIQGNALPLGKFFSFPDVWRTVFALGRWLFFIPAFFTVQLVCAELELKLVRAQVIAGLERREVVLGWIAQNILLTSVGLVACLAAALAMGTRAGGEQGWGLAMLGPSLSGFVLYGICFLNCAVLAAVLLRRPVPALLLLILWPMAIEPAGGAFLEHYGWERARDFLPFASLATLAPWPGFAGDFAPLTLMTLVALGYGVAAALLSGWRLAAMDL